MIEVPFFFANAGYDLFGILHEPRLPRRDIGFVFCAPFGEEKLWAHRELVDFARELARRGYPILRFDYRGTGDSEGDFDAATPNACVADIQAAVAALRERSGPLGGVGLLGLRFGATLAALAAASSAEVRHLILWSPIVRGAAYAQELLRVNLAMQLAQYKEVRHDRDALVQAMREGRTTNIDGYEISHAMYEEMCAIDLASAAPQPAVRALVVQVAPQTGAPASPELARLASLYAEGNAIVSIAEPFWKEIKPLYGRAEHLYADTLRELEQASHAL